MEVRVLVDVITVFPEMVTGPLGHSILKRARDCGLLEVHVHDLRDFTHDRHRSVDDCPFGGGAGMVMRPEPFFEAVEFVRENCARGAGGRPRTILLSPQGVMYTQKKAVELSTEPHLLLLCGHYEGIDERVRLALADEEVSIGDYVLTGGELAAMVLIDSIARLTPGVIAEGSTREESFREGLLEYPQYTRPREYRGMCVPDVLVSGDHAKIRGWRRKEALRRTLVRRPDLLRQARLTDEDRMFLQELERELGDGCTGWGDVL